MSRKGFLVLALFSIVFAALPVMAHDGMVPIFGVTAIGASGKYHLTTNITAPGPVITIAAGATDVDLDLNGFTITETTGAAAGISVPAPGGPDHLVIHNGTLAGGTSGIDIALGFAPPVRRVVIDGIKVHDTTGPGIHLGEVATAAVRNTEIQSAAAEGILWNGGPTKSGTIENNVIRACPQGLGVFGCSSVAILSNRFEDIIAGGPPFGEGIELGGCSVGLVAENTIETTSADGIFIRGGKGMKLFDNVIQGAGCNGIHLDMGTFDTLVWKNEVSANGFGAIACPAPQPAGDGIMVEGDRNAIEGNTVNGNARMGIQLTGPGSAPPNPAGACFNSFTLNSTVGNAGPVAPCVGAPGAPIPPDLCNAVGVGLCAAGSPGNTSGGHNVKAGSAVY